MADDKSKTQLGPPPGRTHRPTGGEAPVVPPKTSYLPETKDPLLGTTIAGRYLVSRKLGEGGMGTVYLATHTILEKQVALKVLHGEFARKPDLVERFMQEAKSASRIRHENVIDISDFGSTPEGLVFFAMELLHGHDLHDEVARARASGHLLPWSRSKKIFLQICAALSAAHAKGVVHRDLKPENVYLVDFLGDSDFVKLLDFGIAKLTEVPEDGGRKLTKTGMLFGTPEYMSPEQARGENVDHRVDVYAMGCILFQLVSGRVPFEAENFMGVLALHLTEPPPQIAPETFDHIGAPRGLGDVIERALAKDRNVRWQTIDALAAAVREVCGDPPLADRSQPHRAPSVPAPATTTRAKSPTTPVAVAREGTGRVKTQWTGDLKVPEIAVESAAPPAKSRLPLVVGLAIVVLGGGAVAAYLATRDRPTEVAQTPVASPGSGSAAVATTTPPPAPPPPDAAPSLPESSMIEIDSTPHGATVTDLSNNQTSKTPAHYRVDGSLIKRQYKLHLRGYMDSIVEITPSRPEIKILEPLAKGTATPGVVKTVPEDAGGAITHPDVGSAKPPETKDNTVPEPPKPPPPVCDELTDPGCLKNPLKGSNTP